MVSKAFLQGETDFSLFDNRKWEGKRRGNIMCKNLKSRPEAMGKRMGK